MWIKCISVLENKNESTIYIKRRYIFPLQLHLRTLREINGNYR